MTQQEIVTMIQKKLEEHKVAMEEVEKELQSTKKEKTIESASKFMVLKDKGMFHRAIILGLNDVLKEIK